MFNQIFMLIPLVLINSGYCARFFTGCEISASNKTVDPGYKCYTTSYGPNNASLNFEMFLNRPVYDFMVFKLNQNNDVSWKALDFQMDFEYSRKVTSKKYTILFKVDNSKLCEALNGTSSNSMLKYIIYYNGKSVSDQLHACPYKVGNLRPIPGNWNQKNLLFLGWAEISWIDFRWVWSPVDAS